MEVHGLVKVKVNDETYGKIKVNVQNNDKKGIQLQVNKRYFLYSHCILDRHPLKIDQITIVKNHQKIKKEWKLVMSLWQSIINMSSFF